MQQCLRDCHRTGQHQAEQDDIENPETSIKTDVLAPSGMGSNGFLSTPKPGVAGSSPATPASYVIVTIHIFFLVLFGSAKV